MKVAFVISALLASQACAEESVANPIRKVVSMLQMMQKKVQAEGEKEQELFDKFMCYCKNSGGALDKSIADAGDAIPELGANIEAGVSQLAQLKEDLKKAQVDRAAAKSAMSEATAIREKDAAAYATESGDLKTNLAALEKALAAIAKGTGGAFLQTAAGATLRNVVEENDALSDLDRHDLTSFLSNDAGSTDSGAIVGILKQMGDTMTKTLGDVVAAEEAAVKSYDSLIKAKTSEVEALTAAIEEKTVRIGELGVEIVQMKEDLSDTQASLIEDKKFAAELEKSCPPRRMSGQSSRRRGLKKFWPLLTPSKFSMMMTRLRCSRRLCQVPVPVSCRCRSARRHCEHVLCPSCRRPKRARNRSVNASISSCLLSMARKSASKKS